MSSRLILFIAILLISSVGLYAQSNSSEKESNSLVGHWTFDNPMDLLKASVGKDLVLHGTDETVAGPKAGDGAVRIGIGSYYKVDHGMKAKKGKERIEEFSIVFDVKMPKGSKWYALFQTDITNKDEADCFINDKGAIGASKTGYAITALKPNEWYRIGISAKKRDHYDYYVDGFRVYKGLSWYVNYIDEKRLLLFADNSLKDNEIDVADVKLYANALSSEDMKALGGYHDKVPYQIAPPDSAIYPYLQSVTESSIYVCWHASNSPQSLVKYGKTEKLGMIQSGDVHIWPDSTTYHTVKLKKLEPNTVYYYQAISNTMKSKIFRFKTAPKRGENMGHIRFAIFGDTRTYPARTKDVMTAIREKVTKLYDDPNIEENLNLVLCNGDVVHYGPNLWEYKSQWFMPMSVISANIPIMVTIGDHEHEADAYYEYMKYEDFAGPLGERQYAFKYGRVLFIADHSITNYMKYMKNYQEIKVHWLNSVLQKAEIDPDIDWVIVFTHRPGHSEIWPNGNERYVQNVLIPLLSKYKKADILTYGHSHAYERGQVTNGNLRLLENGGGGAELDRWREYANQTDYPEIQRTHDYWCYTLVDIDVPNKKYVAKSYGLGHGELDMDNEVFDTFFRDKANEIHPVKPVGITKGVQVYPIILEASPYSGHYDILSSEFQVTSEKGNYDDKLIVDCKRDFEDLYSDSGAPDFIPVNRNEGIDLTKYWLEMFKLKPGKTAWWHVRYRDKNLQWSEWSDELPVTAKSRRQF